jgi:hypothetical protein
MTNIEKILRILTLQKFYEIPLNQRAQLDENWRWIFSAAQEHGRCCRRRVGALASQPPLGLCTVGKRGQRGCVICVREEKSIVDKLRPARLLLLARSFVLMRYWA